MTVLLALFVWWLLRPLPPPAPLTSQQQADIERSLAKTRQTIESLDKDVAKGDDHDFELVVTQAEMNHMLKTDNRAKQAMQNHKIRDAWVQIEPGRMLTSVIRESPAGEVTITAIGRAVITDTGELGAQVDTVQLGRIGIPLAKLKDRMQSALTKVNNKLISSKIKLKEIVMLQEKVIIRGRTTNPNGLPVP